MGHFAECSGKTPEYYKFSKQFQISKQASLSKGCTQKLKQEKLSKSLFNIRFKEEVRKTTCSEIEKPD